MTSTGDFIETVHNNRWMQIKIYRKQIKATSKIIGYVKRYEEKYEYK